MTTVRALLSWLALLAVAFLNGALRQLAYPHSLGDFAARQVAAGLGAVAFGLVIWFVLRRWPVTGPRQAWAVGALWAAMTIAFEVALVRGSGRPWQDVVDQYAIWEGSLWPLLVLWVLLAPPALSAMQRSRIAVGPALGWGVATWLACGFVFAGTRSLLGVDAAVAIHLVAAPFIASGATFLLWNHPRHPGVVGTALTLAGTAALLDVVVVAPFLERSYTMFESLPGTWIPLGLILAASATTAALLSRPAGRRDLLAWVPTAAEQVEPLPGDAFLPVDSGTTHAITIAAPPASVWPWLVQMGLGRAGWYSHDFLDNAGRPSSRTIVPEWQGTATGDLLPPREAGEPGSRSWTSARRSAWFLGSTWSGPSAPHAGPGRRSASTSAPPGALHFGPPVPTRRDSSPGRAGWPGQRGSSHRGHSSSGSRTCRCSGSSFSRSGAAPRKREPTPAGRRGRVPLSAPLDGTLSASSCGPPSDRMPLQRPSSTGRASSGSSSRTRTSRGHGNARGPACPQRAPA